MKFRTIFIASFFIFCKIAVLHVHTESIDREDLEDKISKIEKLNQELRNNLKEQVDLWTILHRNLFDIRHLTHKRQLPGVQCEKAVVFSTRLSKNLYPLGRNQIITYDDVLSNVENGYDKVTGIFEAPLAGLYQVIATMWSNNGYNVDIEMIHNGTDVCYARSTSTNQSMSMCASVIAMQENDRVWVRHLNNNGNYAKGSLYATFSGHKIM